MPLTDQELRKLLDNAFEGSAKSWQDFCQVFFNPVRYFLKIAIKDSGASDSKTFELFQEILSLKDIHPEETIRAYVFKKAFSSAFQTEGRNEKAATTSQAILGKPIWHIQVVQKVQKQEIYNLFERTLFHASFLQRCVLSLYYFGRLSIAEMAQVVSLSEQETEKIFVRAMERVENSIATGIKLPFANEGSRDEIATKKMQAATDEENPDCLEEFRKTLLSLPFPKADDEGFGLECFFKLGSTPEIKSLQDEVVAKRIPHFNSCEVCVARLLAEKLLRCGIEAHLKSHGSDTMETQVFFLVREKLHLKAKSGNKQPFNWEYPLWILLSIAIGWIIFDSVHEKKGVTPLSNVSEVASETQIASKTANTSVANPASGSEKVLGIGSEAISSSEANLGSGSEKVLGIGSEAVSSSVANLGSSSEKVLGIGSEAVSSSVANPASGSEKVLGIGSEAISQPVVKLASGSGKMIGISSESIESSGQIASGLTEKANVASAEKKEEPKIANTESVTESVGIISSRVLYTDGTSGTNILLGKSATSSLQFPEGLIATVSNSTEVASAESNPIGVQKTSVEVSKQTQGAGVATDASKMANVESGTSAQNSASPSSSAPKVVSSPTVELATAPVETASTEVKIASEAMELITENNPVVPEQKKRIVEKIKVESETETETKESVATQTESVVAETVATGSKTSVAVQSQMKTAKQFEIASKKAYIETSVSPKSSGGKSKNKNSNAGKMENKKPLVAVQKPIETAVSSQPSILAPEIETSTSVTIEKKNAEKATNSLLASETFPIESKPAQEISQKTDSGIETVSKTGVETETKTGAEKNTSLPETVFVRGNKTTVKTAPEEVASNTHSSVEPASAESPFAEPTSVEPTSEPSSVKPSSAESPSVKPAFVKPPVVKPSSTKPSPKSISDKAKINQHISQSPKNLIGQPQTQLLPKISQVPSSPKNLMAHLEQSSQFVQPSQLPPAAPILTERSSVPNSSLKPPRESRFIPSDWNGKTEFIRAILFEHPNELKEGPIDLNQWVLNGWLTVRERIKLTPSMDGFWAVVKDGNEWNVYVAENTKLDR
ncbi:MAG: hypothetical protein HQM08_11815 [Candidatus Riflebacteria bacterium]|nr:hypothetical protein [Candidatus Riflebacteria bacterium]